MPILKALRPLFNFHREICIVTAELRINAVAVWHAPYMCLSCVHSSVYTCLNRHCQCQLYSCFLLPDSKNTYIKHLHFVGLFGFVFCFFCVHPLFLFFPRVGKVDTPPGNAFISNYTYEGGAKVWSSLYRSPILKNYPRFFRWVGVCSSLFF